MAQVAILNNLEFPNDYDVLSVDLDEDPSDAICSISEGEGANTLAHIKSALENILPDKFGLMMKEDLEWRCAIKLSKEQEECNHEWEHNMPI
ncbi:hypothetical protein MA16_Dca020211 [Dendrobium catenatum]|uniref:Uncharacterized protein n=1 Tax=Dendrobium catenatum TaxID=906689 RepID=A0A2I0WHV9_9ASPA|nr:hypothetical protein MA16_Dca020211 [Dendrobium catenatum]